MTPDPLAAALSTVLARRERQNHVAHDDLTTSRQLRELAQICWMRAGEPERLRSEDADRAEVCRELVRPWHRGRDRATRNIADAQRRRDLRST